MMTTMMEMILTRTSNALQLSRFLKNEKRNEKRNLKRDYPQGFFSNLGDFFSEDKVFFS